MFETSFKGAATSAIKPNYKDATISTAKTAAKVAGTVVPFVDTVTVLVGEIYKIYKDAESNKDICRIMLDRVKTAEFAMHKMMLEREENKDEFSQKEYFRAFEKFVFVLKNIREYTGRVSKIQGYKKYLNSTEVKKKYSQLTKDYDECIKDLHLTLAISSENQRAVEAQKVDKALMDIDETLGKLGDRMERLDDRMERLDDRTERLDDRMDNITQHLNIINSKISERSDDFYVQKIPSNELAEPPSHRSAMCGSKNNIMRRYTKIGVDVSCKPIGDSKEHLAELAILEQLSLSPNIRRFYGLSTIDTGDEVMVFEWTEYGTLRELYKSYDIPWTRKIQIIRDLCCGFLFLRQVNIFHHDVRCENVFVTKGLEPKLGNFGHARRTTSKISSDLSSLVTDNIRWMAPEQIKKYLSKLTNTNRREEETRYTFNCEMFSFGMLIWELCYEEFPYKDWDHTKIANHVLSCKRTRLPTGKFDRPDDEKIQQEFIKIIEKMWKHEPSERMTITELFMTIDDLSVTYPVPKDARALLDDQELDFEGITKKTENLLPPEFNEELDIDDYDDCDISPTLPLKEGVKFHEKGDYENAWKCFKDNAEIGNVLAKYWQGYYLYEGRFVEKNIVLANQLFKETADSAAADGVVPDAQYRYACSLLPDIKNEEKRIEFLHYLKLAADKKHVNATYSLGDIYVRGKLRVKKNKELGLQYLEVAAEKGLEKAKRLLKEIK